MKRLLKIIGITIGSILSAVIIYLLFAFCLSRIPVNSDAVSSEEITIYILTNGVHTDIVVPAKTTYKDWTASLPFKNTIANDSTAPLLAFGWGDKGFYLETPTWGDLKASTALKAASGLSTSAMHTTYYRSLREDESCRKIGITTQQYQQLIEFIDSSFKKDENGKTMFIKTDAVYGNNDAFYDAIGSYSLFHTCNTWANNALKSANRKACLWTPFDTGIFKMYE